MQMKAYVNPIDSRIGVHFRISMM